jgi:hypothetical protein
MRRLFWIGAGATVVVLVVRKVGQAASRYTPEGLTQSLTSLGDGLRELASAVREGMQEREEELRFALGIDTQTLPENRRLDADGIRGLLDDPTGPRAR